MSKAPRNAPLVLIIRDGWGENPNLEHDAFNAIKIARTPVNDELDANWPRAMIRTSGEDVGLPKGTMGNSEVGHQNIGAGRIVDQEIMRITRAIHDGSFFKNPALLGAFEHAKKTGGAVHLLGLVSDGQVHSDIEHLFALIDLAAKLDFPGERVFIHAFTDGRDVGPKTGADFLRRLTKKLNKTNIGSIASVIGRYYAMDRDHRWDRVAWAYAALVGGGVSHPTMQALVGGGWEHPQPPVGMCRDAVAAVEQWYAQQFDANRVGDEFVQPTIIVDENDDPAGRVGDGDAVIFFNFRGDRPREITKAFVLDDAAWKDVKSGGFDRGKRIENLYYCTMTGYESGLPVTAIAFEKPPRMANILGEVISRAGLTQFRCAETEKFAHVTFFFNDYREGPFPGEHRTLIQSPTEVTTYDQKPEMSAHGVCDAVLSRLKADDCEALIVVNFANPDMVGHSGRLDAVVRAVEVVDECTGRIMEAAVERGGSCIITADHGNAEQMYDPVHQSPHTAHTTYDVPLYIVGEALRNARLRESGRLADIAPTVLAMLGIEQPTDMTGRSLIEEVVR